MWIIFLQILMLILLSAEMRCEFEQQPKIETRDGVLLLQAAVDKNITFRLSHDSALFVNNFNVLELIKQKFGFAAFEEDAYSQRPVQNVHNVVNQMRILKQDLQQWEIRLTNFQNRSRNTVHITRVRRLLGRIRSLNDRISIVEKNLRINECEGGEVGGNPCKNGGTCYDGYKNFHCECVDGWTGKTCEDDVDECYILAGTDLGCQNSAVCVNTLGSYRCACRKGFAGTHCRIRNVTCEQTQSTELCGYGVCVNINNQLGYTCICNQGWTKNNATPACNIDVNECEESRNPCHSECINLPGSFKCGPCPHGYTGNGVKCVDINECAVNNGGCSLQPRVRCVNTEGSYRCGNCPHGWVGDGYHCEETKSNSCDSENICHPKAKCEYISDTVVCTCPQGMYGHGFGVNGCSLDQNTPHLCDNHECKNNATCVVSGRGTHCICAAGYIGPLCDKQDACQSNPCQNGGTCHLLPQNNYRCACARGSTGINCEHVRYACGTILSDETGELSYPPDGYTYQSNERCAWIIRTAESKILNVTFINFDLEDSSECSKDWLQIHDGPNLVSQLIGRFCGKSLPLGGNVVSSHHQLFFWFRSDNATNGSFKLSWTSQDHICGGRLDISDDGSGIIRSPGYPGKTPINRECEWDLNAPYGYRFELRFYEVNLGGEGGCLSDVLKIFDSDLLLRSICVTSKPEPMYTSSNVARIHFHTDSYGADSSFLLYYEVKPGEPHCGGVFTEASGVIIGAMNAAVCLYLIQQPVGTKIRLEFTKFNLLSSEECSLQKVEIFDGKSDENDPLIKRICGSQEMEPLVSSTNYMLLRYEYLQPGFHLQKNFEAKYSRVCDATFFGPDGGVFTTPNYPNPYFEHMTCTFDLYGPLATVVHVNFTDFFITESVPNLIDVDDDTMNGFNRSALSDDYANYVDVYLSSTNKRRFYKGEYPLHLISENNRLRIVFHADVNSRRARGIRVEYSFVKTQCGGVLINEQDSFSILKMRAVSLPYCQWIIEAPPNKHIFLDLRYERTRPTCSPGDAHLYLYSNDTDGSGNLLSSYCQEQHITEIYHTNILTIILNDPRSTIQIPSVNIAVFGNYSFVDSNYVCGGNFKSRFGVIKSPFWPKLYGPFMNCTWVISAPLGHKIELSIRNFSVETTSDKCTDDWLEIRNGKDSRSPLIGKYCGSKIPARIPSFGNHLYLHFATDELISDFGFYLTWEQTETGCGGKLTSHKGSIHSPHNFDIDGGFVSCDWQITVAQGSNVEMSLTNTGRKDGFCNNRMITIYDGPTSASSLLKFNCSKGESIIKLKSSGNQVLVRYIVVDDDSLQFIIDYDTNCNVQIDKIQGVIESPNFPENYPPGVNCHWDIFGGKNNIISLTFSHLEVELQESECIYDFVEIWDMQNDVVLKKRHLCKMPLDILTNEGNHVVLKFQSDYSETKRGFRAEFKRLGCGEHVYGENGIIETPNAPYSVDMICDWYIEVPSGKQIVLDIAELHIETQVQDCDKDVIIVSESKNDTVPLLKECQVEQTPITITSPANHLYIHFETSSLRSRKYFKAKFVTKRSSCGGVYRGNSGYLTSPNYPDMQKSIVKCTWTIAVDDSYGINVEFLELNVSASHDCVNSNVQLEKNTVLEKASLGRFCGYYQQLTKRVHGNQLDVIFKIGTQGWGKFALKYQKQCGGSIKNSFGFIKSRIGEDCIWEIFGSEGSHISLDILHLECECSQHLNKANCTNGLRISSENDEDEETHICTGHQTNIIFPVSVLRIRSSQVNFRAKYSTIQQSCGGILTSLRGILVSPYYPNAYPAQVECIWEIRASSGNYIEVNFEMLDISKSTRCNEDFLEMRSTNEQGQILGLYCSNDVPTESLVAYERMWIKFRSVAGSTAKGFKISWNYAHLNEINGTEGLIEAPPVYSTHDISEEFYEWRITVTRGNRIFLEFKEYNVGLFLFDGYDDVALQIEIASSPWQFYSSSNVVYLRANVNELEQFKIKWSAIDSGSIKENATASKCHETLTINHAQSRNVSSPGFPTGYPAHTDCTWIIKPNDPSEHVVFSLYYMKLEESYQCYADYLSVSTSSNLVDWHEELKICQSDGSEKTVHGTPYLKIHFFSDDTVNSAGYTSDIGTTCGSNLTDPVGAIMMKSLWQNSDINSTCYWQITVRPGKRIQLNFEYNDSMFAKSDPCDQYAIIYDGLDGNAPILPPGQICNKADRNVKQIMTTGHQAMVKYKLFKKYWENIEPQHFWNLTYREFSECDGELRLTHFSNSVNISSPRYPNVPQPHTECNWIVIAPVGETIRADFVDRFDMNHRYCDEEFIELYDGATKLARRIGHYCYRPVDTIRTTSNVLYARYVTNIAEPRNGFRLNVSIALCGGTYGGFSGEITSTNYPVLGGYSKFSTCEYVFKMPESARMRLNFTDVHLPFDEKNIISSDRIDVMTIGEPNKLIATIYGNSTDLKWLQIDSNMVLVRFRSFHGNDKYRGFRLQYEREYSSCYRDVSGESGIITMTNPERSTMCRWKIKVPKGQRIRLTIFDIELTSRSNISAKYPLPTYVTTPLLRFYNDIELNSKITEFTVAQFNSSTVVESTDNFMYIQINLGNASPAITKISARYSSDNESPCPEDIADSTSGSINVNTLKSLNTYFCSLQFVLNGQETISFKIENLQTFISNTERAHFAIRFKDEELFSRFKFLNQDISNILVSYSPRRGSVSILQSEAVQIRQFSTQYRRHPCGGFQRLEAGFVVNNPKVNIIDYGQMECVWTLRGAYDKTYKLRGNVSLSDSCEREYITLFAGLTTESPQIIKICRDSSDFNDIVLKSYSTLMIYHVENYKPRQSHFEFISEKVLTCGSNTRVRTTSENVAVDATTYKNNIECSWEFETNRGLYLAVSFEGRFFIEDSVNCTNDYLEVQSFKEGIWTSEARYCGRNIPTILNTTENHIQVIFRTNEAVTGDGFAFKVSLNCIVTFNVTNQTQVIVSPKIRGMRYSSMHCEYTLLTDSDKLINVHISEENEHSLAYSPLVRCKWASITAYKKLADGEMQEGTTYCSGSAEIKAYHFLRLDLDELVERSFQIKYWLNECGGNITRPAILRSLENEEQNTYANNMNCVWYITAPHDHSVVVRFKYLEMDIYRTDCEHDYVTIYAGTVISDDKRIAKLCGNLTADAPIVMIDSNVAMMTAVSDGSYSDKGFLAEVFFTSNCNERITLSDGNSPVTLVRHFNVNASEHILCYYNVMAPEGYRVSIELKDLQLNNFKCENCDNCNHIELEDSVGASRASIGTFCSNGRSLIKAISSFEDALLKLSISQGPGKFSLEIVLQMSQSSCGGRNDLQLQNNQFLTIVFPLTNSTELYPANTHCTWTITSDEDFELVFNSLLVQNASQTTGTCLDYLHIKSLQYAQYFCGNASGFHVHILKYHESAIAEITFHSDEDVEDRGFYITAMPHSNCNRTYTKLSGLIKYNLKNSQLTPCESLIEVPKNYTLSIFIIITLVPDVDCSNGHFKNHIEIIDVTNNNKTLMEHCDSIYTLFKLHTVTNSVRIYTNYTTTMELLYIASSSKLPPGCGGEIYSAEGEFTSPPYHNDRNFSECRWDLIMPIPNRMEIYFFNFNMGSNVNCQLDYVSVLEVDRNGNEQSVRRFCGSDNPSIYISKRSHIAIISKKTPNFDGNGWSLRFSTH